MRMHRFATVAIGAWVVSGCGPSGEDDANGVQSKHEAGASVYEQLNSE